jgi:predicted RNA binding protein YcfA (HicA-like mRNA interferase family)
MVRERLKRKALRVEHPDRSGVRITIPTHGGREVPIKTVRSIIKSAALTAEEFEELL